MSTITDAAQGFLNVVTDPCLPDVGQLLLRLHELEAASADPSQPTQASIGIGLCKVVTPLKAVVYLRENPVVAVLGIAGFLGVFVGIGYKMGSRRTLGKLSGFGDPWHDHFSKGADDANRGRDNEPDKFKAAYRAGHAYAMNRRNMAKKAIDV